MKPGIAAFNISVGVSIQEDIGGIAFQDIGGLILLVFFEENPKKGIFSWKRIKKGIFKIQLKQTI